MSRRPRPTAPLVIDPDNAYARAKLSPTMATEAIRKELIARRNQLLNQARRSAGDTRLTALVEDVSGLIDQIGNAQARAAYDRLHPQNELLTVQAPQCDAAAVPTRRASLVTSWVIAETSPAASVLPHPESPALWLAASVAPELLLALAPFTTTQIATAEPRDDRRNRPDCGQSGSEP